MIVILNLAISQLIQSSLYFPSKSIVFLERRLCQLTESFLVNSLAVFSHEGFFQLSILVFFYYHSLMFIYINSRQSPKCSWNSICILFFLNMKVRRKLYSITFWFLYLMQLFLIPLGVADHVQKVTDSEWCPPSWTILKLTIMPALFTHLYHPSLWLFLFHLTRPVKFRDFSRDNQVLELVVCGYFTDW